MILGALQLDAFHAVAKARNFTRAARALHVTQSALSQRVKSLEASLERQLFVRGASGHERVTLTDAGERLLRYCQTREALESEVVLDLGVGAAPSGDVAGMVRVAAFSSVVRSVVLPALAPLLRAHPRLQVEVMSREMSELPELFTRATADLCLLDHVVGRGGVEHALVGHEVLVFLESAHHPERSNVVLDHDPNDQTTARFLSRHGGGRSWRVRSFLDDVYGVLDGVALGIGRAVVSRHLAGEALARGRVRRVKGYRERRAPVYLHWWKQPAYARAQSLVRDVLVSEMPRFLR